ncbi:MAG: hypothetical protein RBR09_03810 [Desulfobulbaceae bacterium]|jgi:hypothetical protein|nr:hypothetical protein [Desulfobulbaceae bacterium]MDY0350357.1 hypothetical protein [Desulfobulbaceae bacterium]
MNGIHTTIRLCVVLFFLLSAGCSQTSVTGVWKKSDFAGPPFRSVLVVALTGEDINKALWENIMADQLNRSNISAVPCTQAFPRENNVTREKIEAYVRQHAIEGMLVTRLVDTRTEQVYHPPRGVYYGGPFWYYNHFYNYYPYVYDRVYSPGYTSTHTIVLLETNLYQAATQELVWSMSSDTFDPRSINQLVESVSKKVIQGLRKDRLIPPAK